MAIRDEVRVFTDNRKFGLGAELIRRVEHHVGDGDLDRPLLVLPGLGRDQEQAKIECAERVDLTFTLHRFFCGKIPVFDPGDNSRRRDARYCLSLPGRQTH